MNMKLFMNGVFKLAMLGSAIALIWADKSLVWASVLLVLALVLHFGER